MNPPDWTTLRILLAAIEAGSVTKAAEKCGIAVSAAARRIQDLETDLGIQIFERMARGVTPTPAGEMVARHARSMVDFSLRLNDDLRAFMGGGLGSVRLSASLSAIAGHPLADALSKFMGDHPGITVELQELTSLSTLQHLMEGRADLGIVTIPRAIPEGLEARQWRTDQLLVVVPEGHALATRETLRFAEALSYPLIGVLEQGGLSLLLEEAAERLGLRPRYSFRVASVEVAVRLVAAGQGITIMPDGVLPIFNPELGLAGVRLKEPWAQRHLKLVSRPTALLPPAARLLLDHLSAMGNRGSSIRQPNRRSSDKPVR
jgi:DNA-binding transcriptional LysR family regulator